VHLSLTYSGIRVGMCQVTGEELLVEFLSVTTGRGELVLTWFMTTPRGNSWKRWRSTRACWRCCIVPRLKWMNKWGTVDNSVFITHSALLLSRAFFLDRT